MQLSRLRSSPFQTKRERVPGTVDLAPICSKTNMDQPDDVVPGAEEAWFGSSLIASWPSCASPTVAAGVWAVVQARAKARGEERG